MKDLTDEQVWYNRKERLKSARYENQFSLNDVAHATGVSVSTLARWESGETGNIKIPQLHKLAQMYHVDAAWLFGYDTPKNPETQEHKTLRDEISNKLRNATTEELKRVLSMIDIIVDHED